jgi:Uma2 family endonuclease
LHDHPDMGLIESPRQLARHRLTVADFHRLGAAGVLAPQDRVELIQGELVDMAPIGTRHASTVMRLNQRLVAAVGPMACVSVQSPLHVDDLSEPQPDLMLLRPRADFYRDAHPRPADVLLLIEVSDTTARYDREIKLPLYAAAAVPEVWIVDLEAGLLRCHRSPSGGEYTQMQALAEPGLLPLPGLDGTVLDLAGVLA